VDDLGKTGARLMFAGMALLAGFLAWAVYMQVKGSEELDRGEVYFGLLIGAVMGTVVGRAMAKNVLEE